MKPGLVPFDQFIDPAGKVEIKLGDAACIVGGEKEGDIPVADVDVRIMPEFFGNAGDLVDKRYCRAEPGKPEPATQAALLAALSGEGAQRQVDIPVAQRLGQIIDAHCWLSLVQQPIPEYFRTRVYSG